MSFRILGFLAFVFLWLFAIWWGNETAAGGFRGILAGLILCWCWEAWENQRRR